MMKKGARTGQGLYTFKNGDTYTSIIDRTVPGKLPYVVLIGLIKQIHSTAQKRLQQSSQPQGTGISSTSSIARCRFNDGSIYYGYIKNGTPTGHGKFTFPNGDSYTSTIDRSKPGTLPYKVLIGLIKDIHANALKKLSKVSVREKNGMNIDAYKYKKN